VTAAVALLRGVNLGGRKVVMSELRDACAAAGLADVRTLLASGNMVLDAKAEGRRLEKKLEQVIADALGLKTDVFVRTAAEMKAIVAANRFKTFAKEDPSHLVVHFLRAPPSVAELAAMDASKAHESFHVGTRCLYITYPDGIGPSKLKLPKLGTSRNWNTVTKLAAMAAGE
jgi:uncharacterized protein (DUF1697 family)